MTSFFQIFDFHYTTLTFVMLSATCIFFYHSSTILDRFLDNSVAETVYSVRNMSLIMPVVHMQLERQRKLPVSNNTVLPRMGFKAFIDDKEVPRWASPVKHDRTLSPTMEVWLHSISLNRVSLPVS